MASAAAAYSAIREDQRASLEHLAKRQAAEQERFEESATAQKLRLGEEVADLAGRFAGFERTFGSLMVHGDRQPESIVRAGSLDVCEVACLGFSDVPIHGVGSADEIAVPMLFPLLGRGNIFIDAPWSDTVGWAMIHICQQALELSGPGQVAVSVVDPELKAPLAMFAPLREVSDSLWDPGLADIGRLPTFLSAVATDVRRISSLFAGTRKTLTDLRKELNQPVESYRVVFICDYPRGFSQESVDQLVGISRLGPQCGVTLVLHRVPSVAGMPMVDDRWQDLSTHASIITMNGSVAQDERATDLPFTIPSPDPSLPTRIRDIAKWAQDGAVPVIDFWECQPEAGRLMWDSSAARLVAAIGKDGSEPVEIMLGDERDQRHNILITGAVGQGKSNLILSLIHSLARRYPPEELEFHLLDFKEGVTLEPLAWHEGSDSWLPHARTIGINSNREFGAAVLAHLVREFDRRADIIRSFGDNISRYRAENEAHRMARIVLVIDEFQVLFEEDDDLTEVAVRDLESLARKGRAYGIHLILASQTISGVRALLAKQDGIFAQFPIRLALKNSKSESQAVLEQGNDEAARLRNRGAVVVNRDFGLLEGNRRAMVALADPDTLKRLRAEIVASLPTECPTPEVHDGSSVSSLLSLKSYLRTLSENAQAGRTTRDAILGRAVDVGAPPVVFHLDRTSGRNLAVLGSGHSRSSASGYAHDQSVGILQSAAVSLALQHPRGAEFTLLNCLADDIAAAVDMCAFANLLNAMGHDVRLIAAQDAANYFRSVPELLASRSTAGSTSSFVLGFSLDRAALKDDVTGFDSGPSSVEGLRALVSDGPAVGTHLLASWTTARTMQQQLGYGNEGAVHGIVLLRVSRNDAHDVLGPYANWTHSGNRGLFTDQAEGATHQVFIPFGPLSEQEISAMASERWST